MEGVLTLILWKGPSCGITQHLQSKNENIQGQQRGVLAVATLEGESQRRPKGPELESNRWTFGIASPYDPGTVVYDKAPPPMNGDNAVDLWYNHTCLFPIFSHGSQCHHGTPGRSFCMISVWLSRTYRWSHEGRLIGAACICVEGVATHRFSDHRRDI
jgi:hypothetical protein